MTIETKTIIVSAKDIFDKNEKELRSYTRKVETTFLNLLFYSLETAKRTKTTEIIHDTNRFNAITITVAISDEKDEKEE